MTTDLRDQLAAFEAAARRALTAPQPTGRPAVRLTSGRNLGPLLRRLREEAGLTGDQLGARIHLTRRGICARELHGSALPVGALIETAHALGYRVALIPQALTPDRRTA
jgi:DNA-binding XRE family transcriptional regulator